MWYTSVLELQLASLQCCIACRAANTKFTVRVTEETPTHVWTSDLGPSTRVPVLRAAGLRWKLPSSALPRGGGAELMRGLVLLDLPFFDCAEDIVWPAGLRQLMVRIHGDGDLLAVCRRAPLPATIQRLTLVGFMAAPLTNLIWPSSLKQLTLLLNDGSECGWPESVEELTIGGEFNEPIGGFEWPSSLRDLTFGDQFDQPLDGTVWPPSLLRLEFRGVFDQPVTGAAWPPCLRQLVLSSSFNHPIIGVVWPATLEKITFGGGFDQPIEGTLWPSSLRYLEFGDSFSQPVSGVDWPLSLGELSFGCSFNQPIADVVWPASLVKLTFGLLFAQPIEAVAWPASLRELTFGAMFRHKIGTSLAMLEKLNLGLSFGVEIDLPASVTVTGCSIPIDA